MLTNKQQSLLSFIQSYIDEQKRPPTLTVLQDFLGITKRGVVKHLEALEKKGLIARTGRQRGIVIQNYTGQQTMFVELLGYANAGLPMVVAEEEKLGTLRIERTLLPVTRNLFALVIKGDSMDRREINGSNLENGNYAIVSKDQEVHNGDVVLAIIDGCATIKTLKRDKNLIVLYPESRNPRHQPIYLEDDSEGSIYGKVVAVLDNPIHPNNS